MMLNKRFILFSIKNSLNSKFTDPCALTKTKNNISNSYNMTE